MGDGACKQVTRIPCGITLNEAAMVLPRYIVGLVNRGRTLLHD
jgi:hypothetical protein